MISVVIPLFNEEASIKALYERLMQAAPQWNMPYEIIFVDDGSQDRTCQLIKEKCAENQNLKLVRLSRNFGHQVAFSAGMKYAKGNAVVLMDGDLQDPPELISSFIKHWKQGYEIVYAIRKNRKEGFFKKMAYATFYKINNKLSYINIPENAGDFSLLDARVVHIINNEMTEYNRFIRGMRAYAGFKQIGVEFNRAERVAGEPKYTYRKLLKLAFDGFLDYSSIPLRLATYLGFAISFITFSIGLFFIVHRIFDFKVLGYSPSDTPGLATLAVGVFFLGGVILLSLGLIGEYLGRIYLEVKKRPVFIVDELVNLSAEKTE